MLNILGIKIM